MVLARLQGNDIDSFPTGKENFSAPQKIQQPKKYIFQGILKPSILAFGDERDLDQLLLAWSERWLVLVYSLLADYCMVLKLME